MAARAAATFDRALTPCPRPASGHNSVLSIEELDGKALHTTLNVDQVGADLCSNARGRVTVIW